METPKRINEKSSPLVLAIAGAGALSLLAYGFATRKPAPERPSLTGKITYEGPLTYSGGFTYGWRIETPEGDSRLIGTSADVYSPNTDQPKPFGVGDEVKIDLRGIDQTYEYGPRITDLKYTSIVSKNK